MWFACVGIVLVVNMVMLFTLHLDLFRSIFFLSPAWITCIVGPFQKDRNAYKLGMFMVFMFLGYWSTVHCFPCQCRHAWGTMMVADLSYWPNNTAIQEAVLQELNSYYLMKDLDHASWSVPPSSKQHGALQGVSAKDPSSVSTLLEMLKQEEQARQSMEAPHAMVKKWIAPLTGGLSLDNLKLRAYCNIHRNDKKMPHVYPLKVVGIAAQQMNFTLPCPHWTCLLTEARPGGKLIYFEILALTGLLTYTHYRFDCLGLCVWVFGTGQPRIWWLWFWASLLPLWLVMLLKTTHDQELGETLSGSIMWSLTGARDWFEADTAHQVEFFIALIGGAALYVYRDKVRKELGLDEHSVVYLFPRAQVSAESTFQVCVWRVDVNADATFAKFQNLEGTISEGGSSTQRTNYGHFHESFEEREAPGFDAGNCWIGNRDPVSMVQRAVRSYLPLVQRAADGNFLRTRDGQLPALCVRMYHGIDEVQSTRTVRPSTVEWAEEGSVLFQENFKLSVQRRPNTQFRVEIRDTSASLGHVSLGHATFSEERLRRQFERSRRAQEELGFGIGMEPVAIQQVILMMRRCSSPLEEEALLRRMVEVGFAPHRLSEGGAVWLAFCDSMEDGDQWPCVCVGG